MRFSGSVDFLKNILCIHPLPVTHHDTGTNADAVFLFLIKEPLNAVLNVAFIVVPTA